MRNYLNILLGLCLVISSLTLSAAEYTTVSAGTWVTAGNWDLGSSPAYNTTSSGDSININHNITLVSDFVLEANSILVISAGDTLTITGDVTFKASSKLIIEGGGNLIINGNVTNNNNSDDITVTGTITINGDYSGGNGSEVGGLGSMEITGTVSTTGSATVFGSGTDCTVDGTCSSSGGPPLPIELLEFRVVLIDSFALITWKTASETNNDFFTIKRSSDGIYFEDILIIFGSGNSTSITTYTAIDKDPLDGVSYYKLKQTDYDGQSEEFKLYWFMRYENVKKIVRIVNMQGYVVDDEYPGIKIYIFDDGSIEKKLIIK